MHIADVVVARIQRFLATRRDPLAALLYDPLLDEATTIEITPPLEREDDTVERYCGFCRKDRPHWQFQDGVEAGVILCTRCGWGWDAEGTFSRGVSDYGRRIK